MVPWLRDLPRDLRYAARLLRESPAFTVVAILTLALGIGANTAVFSIIDGTLLRPLPYRDPQRLVAVWDRSVREARLAKIFASYDDFVDWKRHSQSFDELAAATWATADAHPIMTGRGPARKVLAIPVSSSLFALLGVHAALGRTFTSDDLAHGCSVVLSHAFWSGALGADPHLVGQTIALDRRSCRVLGVAPADFSFYPAATEMWRLITPDFPTPLNTLVVGVFGRLKPGITRQRAQAELVALHDALHRSDGKEPDFAPAVYDLQGEFTWMAGRNLRTTLWILLGAVGMVLLIACVNVANLLLGRSFVRARELAVRAALGGGRARLLQQLLTEGLLLAMLGGALGIAVAFAALDYFRAANPVEMPVGARVEMNTPVLAFTLAASCLTALLFGFAPAWRGSAVSLSDALKSGGRGVFAGRNRLARALVAGEVALSVVLLAGAALLIESVARMGSAPLGFQPDGLLTTAVFLPPGRYADQPARVRRYEQIRSRVAALPGVERVALAYSLPPHDGGNLALEVFGRPVEKGREVHDVALKSITPDYFATLGSSLRRGRVFNGHDRLDSEPVAIIDDALARQYFPHSDPLDQRVRTNDGRTRQPWATIVGIVETQKRTIVYQEMNWIDTPTLFRPLAQDSPLAVSLAIRTGAGAIPMGVAIRREVSGLDSEIVVAGVEPMRRIIATYLSYPRFRAILLGGFGLFALLLAAVGLHGVLGQFVAQRTQEIGVRLALGAQPADIQRLVCRYAGLPVLAGLLVGLASAGLLGRVISGLLYGVRPRDPVTLAAVSFMLLLAAALAIALPARRATRTDPVDALRQE